MTTPAVIVLGALFVASFAAVIWGPFVLLLVALKSIGLAPDGAPEFTAPMVAWSVIAAAAGALVLSWGSRIRER
jgi:hypothetical protein